MAIHNTRLEAARQYYGAGSWALENLNHMTVVFGRNGTGKSLMLRNLRDQQRDQRHYASPERGGDFTFNPSYMQEELEPATRGNRRAGNTAPTYRDEGVARIQAFLAKRGNIRRRAVPVSPDEIEKLINVLLPAFSFTITGGQKPVQLLRVSNSQPADGANQLSSGESALFALGLDLVSICAIWKLDGVAGTLLIDEPDLHLHPDLQQHLASFLVQLVSEFDAQIVIATHSTTLLAALGHYGAERTSVIYLDPTVNDQPANPFSDVERQLATILGGHALMGPLFAVPLLLVEGDDDYKVWAHAARHHVLKVSVVPCEGARLGEYERKLERVFASLIETQRPLAHSIHDLDLRTSQPRSQPGFVQRLWLNCREVENLYLTTEVLQALGTDEPRARRRINSRASRFGQKESQLRQVASNTDWRHVDCKDVINQLSEILDTRRVDWAIRIGAVIGASRPSGQLADFLGTQILNSLWPQTDNRSQNGSGG